MISQKESDILQSLFVQKFKEIAVSTGGLFYETETLWQSFLIKNKIKISSPKYLNEVSKENSTSLPFNFNDIIISNPADVSYLIIPIDLAKKAVILGFLP